LTAGRLPAGTRVVLLDIEGTTTPISFVYDVLFPYARRHLRAFLHEHGSEEDVARAAGMLRDERAGEESVDAAAMSSVAAYAESLMNRDSKSPGLKALQGLIWKQGYEGGDLRGEVFADVPPAMRRWKEQGVRVAIYSSGSVLAQKLIFGSTRHGDLTRFIDGWFDTAVGPKREASSYATIAGSMRVEPASILFLTDVIAEAAAARVAGCRVMLVVRPGNPSQTSDEEIPTIETFERLTP
jgi:enolase-phosphatase E1